MATPHPLEDFHHPDMHAFVAADPQKMGHYGVIADWLEERGHPVLAQVFRRHPEFTGMMRRGDFPAPAYRSEVEHPLSSYTDSRGGKTTELTYHRMEDRLTKKKFHAVNLTHWRWWNPDPEGMNTGHAVSVTAPVTRKELAALVKQYGGKKSGLSPTRDWATRRRERNDRGTGEFPMEHLEGPDAQLAAEDIGGPQQPVRRGGLARPAQPLQHALPTRESAGVSGGLPEPTTGPRHAFVNGYPSHRDEQGNTFIHRPQQDPERFRATMQQLGTPESLHMQQAAETGHRWDVKAADYPHFAKYNPAALAKMSGAVPGDKVSFHVNGIDGSHIVHVTGQGEHAGKTVRTIIDPKKSELYLDTITGPGKGGQGWGGRYFFDALRGARKLGLKTITAGHAIGKPGDRMWNGFYSWPRLGFNGPLPKDHTLPPEHAGARDFHELFDKPGGAEAWKAHGNESFNIQFDTTPGSPHTQRLVKYLRQAAVRRRAQGPQRMEREEEGKPDTEWYAPPLGQGDYLVSEFHPEATLYAQRHPEGNDHWEVYFDRTPPGRKYPSSSLTGDAGHGAVGIMRGVLGGIKKFLIRQSPRSFHFSAAADEPSRVKLYDRAAPILAQQHGYTHEREDNGDVIHYQFKRQGE